jgi:hypothetical protein
VLSGPDIVTTRWRCCFSPPKKRGEALEGESEARRKGSEREGESESQRRESVSEEDKTVDLGKLTKKYLDSKKEVALLQSQLGHLGERLSILGAAISERRISDALSVLEEQSVAKYFNIDELREVLEDSRSADQKLQSLKSQLNSAGVLL